MCGVRSPSAPQRIGTYLRFQCATPYTRSVSTHHPTPEERDEPVAIPLDFETALRAALAVDPATEPVDPLLTIDQAAEIVGLGKSTLHKHVARGALPMESDGERRMIRLSDLNAWAASHQAGRSES